MLSMTYGQLPTKKQFEQHFFRAVEDNMFYMHLKGSDADCFFDWTSWHVAQGHFDVDDLWGVVKELTTAFNDEGAECAGDLASSILSVLDIEWI